MFSLKRSVIAALVLAIALTGVITASAQDEATAWLGVLISDADGGALINQVASDSPADDAGLQHGDIITAADATLIDSSAALVETIQAHAPGDEIAITFKRGDEADTVMVTLGEQPVETTSQSYVPDAAERPMLGMLDIFGLNLELSDEGLVVQSITPDSFFADSGLEPGDVITAIDGEPVLDGTMMPGLFRHLRFDGPVVFTVVRDGEAMDIEVDIDSETIRPEIITPDSDLDIQSFSALRPTQLGVQFLTLDADVAEEEGLDVDQGALIVAVYEDTPAAAAGLQADDIVLAVDGDVVDEERTLADRLVAYEEGDVVTLSVLRAGEDISIEVELGPSNRGLFGQMGETMPFYFQGENGDFFEMHPFGHGDGFFGFDFRDHHPFWGPDGGSDDADSGSSDDTSM